MTPEEKALHRAIALAGSGAELGRRCGVGRQCVQGWKSKRRVPLCRVLDVERAVGAEVTRAELCPTLFARGEAA